jgi:matrixin
MGRAEKFLIALVIGLVVFVAQAIVKQPRHDASAPVPTATESAEATPQSASPPPIAPPVARPVAKNDLDNSPRSSMEPAPMRDLADIKSRLAAGQSATYIGDVLAVQDSVIFRWPERRINAIRVWVSSGKNLPGWSESFADMARSVFGEWGAAGSPLRFDFVLDSVSSDIQVKWINSFGTSRIGSATRLIDQHSWIVGAEIDIAVHDSAGRTFSPIELTGIARHEVGHALGLGHSQDRRTLMFPEETMYDITPLDLATLRLIYTLPPGPVNKP